MSHFKHQALCRQVPIIGTDLPPVRHESTFSVLLRLAASNVWNRSGICRMFELGHAARNCSFHECGPLLQKRINEMTDWDWRPMEQSVDGRLSQLNHIFWDPVLRFCPVCLSSGFHSLWFQFSPMQECPLHRCLLTDRCHQCGAFIGDYRFTAKLFATPFKCPECSKWIAGAPFIHGSDDDLRRHGGSVEIAFAPISAWFNEAGSRLEFLNEVACRWTNSELSLKFLQRRLLTGAMALYHPLPPRLHWVFAAPVDILAWQQKVESPHSCGRDKRHRLGHLRYDRPLLVYRATLRSLRNIVEPWPCEFGAAGRAMARQWWGPKDACQLSTLQAAYLLMRIAFERAIPLNLEANLRRVTLGDDVFAPARVGDTLDRLACRVIVLSAFSMLVSMGGGFCRARLPANELMPIQLSSVIAFVGIALAKSHYCVAILPKIADLPILPSKHVRLNHDVIEVVNIALREAGSARRA